jgi:predicted dehydrogenase
LIELAKEKGLLIGGAPDTFLGGGIQTCKKLIEDGWIGHIIGFNAFMTCHGHESWHPDPEFYYKAGGGPMFDMGPYYLTALVKLLGPVSQVAGLTKKGFEQRTITSQPKKGQEISVDVATHLISMLKLESGAIGQLTTSFDVWEAELPRIEIYGSLGSISVPDPNTFGGPIRLRTKDSEGFMEIPSAYGYTQNSRGIGISNMAEAIASENNDAFEASGNLTYHVLEIMEAIHTSSNEMRFVQIDSRF